MPLYLEPKEKEYLRTALNGAIPKEFWLKDKILEKIGDDDDRLRDISKCEHSFGTYTGVMECCTKCGAFGEGMGEEWTLDKEKDE